MSVDIFPMLSDSHDNKTGYIDLVAIHFKKLSFYNEDWTIEDILVFEVMLVLSRRFGGDKFFHQMRFLKEKTRLSSHIINKSLDKFEELGFVSKSRKGKFRSNIYRVNYEVIKNNLDLIYNFDYSDKDHVENQKKIIQNFYDYYQEYHDSLNYNYDLENNDISFENYEGIEAAPDPEEDVEYLTFEELVGTKRAAEVKADVEKYGW